MVMRRTLGSFLPVLLLTVAPVTLLAACDDDDSGSVAKDPAATDAATSSTSSPSSPSESASEEPFGYRLVDTITVTAAGGTVSELAVPLPDDAAVDEFVAQFTSDDLSHQVEAAVASTDVPDGMELYGAVVAIGCDSPDEVTVDVSDAGVTITAVKVPAPKVECFAATTTVALVLVDK